MRDWIMINLRCFLWLLLGSFICLFNRKFAIRMVKSYGLLLDQELNDSLKRNEVRR